MSDDALPTDAALHAELNDRARESRFKAILTALRSLQHSCDIAMVAKDENLCDTERFRKRHLLANVDRALAQIEDALENIQAP
jgi:hypothetical protein